MRVKDTLSLAVVIALYAAPFAVAISVAAADRPEPTPVMKPAHLMSPADVWAHQVNAMNHDIILSANILTDAELRDQPIYGGNDLQVGTIAEVEQGRNGRRNAVIELPGAHGAYDPLLYVSVDNIYIAKDGRLVMPQTNTLEGV